MKILVTGAAGFVGKNLVCALQNVRDGKDRTHPGLAVDEIMTYDVHSGEDVLADALQRADFVFHLAGANRPVRPEEFMVANRDLTAFVLDGLAAAGNRCPVMLASSVQATLVGRYDGEYGRSKRAAEELVFAYGESNGAEVMVYRFPNLFGKWCRPNYNSVVATFCHNVARGLPISVNDADTELELLYIDDVVEELLRALAGRPARDGRYCFAPGAHRVRLGHIAELLERFYAQPGTRFMPDMPADSFEKKLYSTYLSYLPQERICYPLEQKCDARGSFTEVLRTANSGQFSINVSKPGITKGQHWHNSKWELFVVVSGHGLVRMRRIGDDRVLEFELFGDRPQAVHMLPGYTHSLHNLSDTEQLVTLMWANECFDGDRPDTFFEEV